MAPNASATRAPRPRGTGTITHALTAAGGTGTAIWLLKLAVALLATVAGTDAVGEPWLAVSKGMHCSSCHANPAGGGKRTAYGNAFAQTELPARAAASEEIWTGEIARWLAVGADLRAGYQYVDVPNSEATSEFDITRGNLYVEATVIPGRLSVYVDQQLAPGSSLNREAYARLNGGAFYLMAGQFYLPYGLRLQDDTAFIRQVTGINFTSPDRGIQAGYERGPWSAQASLTNGTAGGTETDSGKQASLLASYVGRRWRAGLSFNFNDADAGDRQMQNVFLGLKTGPVVWLAEVDLVSDDLPAGTERDSIPGLLEANWMFRDGHNLKISYEYFDPDKDVSEDHLERWSGVWEYTPMPFLQVRLGVRLYDGIPQNDFQNRDIFFAEVHGFF